MSRLQKLKRLITPHNLIIFISDKQKLFIVLIQSHTPQLSIYKGTKLFEEYSIDHRSKHRLHIDMNETITSNIIFQTNNTTPPQILKINKSRQTLSISSASNKGRPTKLTKSGQYKTHSSSSRKQINGNTTSFLYIIT